MVGRLTGRCCDAVVVGELLGGGELRCLTRAPFGVDLISQILGIEIAAVDALGRSLPCDVHAEVVLVDDALYICRCGRHIKAHIGRETILRAFTLTLGIYIYRGESVGLGRQAGEAELLAGLPFASHGLQVGGDDDCDLLIGVESAADDIIGRHSHVGVKIEVAAGVCLECDILHLGGCLRAALCLLHAEVAEAYAAVVVGRAGLRVDTDHILAGRLHCEVY